MTVDELLNAGATGLRFFETFLPRIEAAGFVPTTALPDLSAAYDQQRGMQTATLADGAAQLGTSASTLRDNAASQRACGTTLAAGWEGSAATAAGEMMSTALDRADECVGAMQHAADALGAAANGLTDIVSEKSTTAAQFDRADACGRTASQIDATIAAAHMMCPTADQRAELATLYPGTVTALDQPATPTDLIGLAPLCAAWLGTEFVPYMADRVAAFEDMCTHADTAVRAVFDAIGAAFAELDGITFPSPDAPADVCAPAPAPDSCPAPVPTGPANAPSPAPGIPSPEPVREPATVEPVAVEPAAVEPVAVEPATDTCVRPELVGPGTGSSAGELDLQGLGKSLARAAVGVVDAVASAVTDAVTGLPDDVGAGPVAPVPASPPAVADGAERGHIEAELDGYGARLALADNGSVTLALTDPESGTREFEMSVGPDGLPVLAESAPDSTPPAALEAPVPVEPPAPASLDQPDAVAQQEPEPEPQPQPAPAPPEADTVCAPTPPAPAPALDEAGPAVSAPAVPAPDLAEAGTL